MSRCGSQLAVSGHHTSPFVFLYSVVPDYLECLLFTLKPAAIFFDDSVLAHLVLLQIWENMSGLIVPEIVVKSQLPPCSCMLCFNSAPLSQPPHSEGMIHNLSGF